MDFNELKNVFDNCELAGEKIIIKSDVINTIRMIKDKYHFDMLKEITAVDKKESGIELIYRLYSVENEEELILSIMVNDEAESVSDIFDSAVADEKEIYDLFGVKFHGNSELERLYMPESWQGHPLRKNYTESDERLEWND